MSVYFVRAAALNLVKIGFAEDPWKRFSKIQSDSPCPVEIVGIEDGGLDRERVLHSLFAEDRVSREWFRWSGEISQYVRTLPKVYRTTKRAKYGCAQMSRETGWGKPYCSHILTGRSEITIRMAVHIYRTTGRKMGPVESASDPEMAVLVKFHPELMEARA